MASPTWWTWDWVNSRSWWWTERPGVRLFMGSQRVGHSWATELNSLDALMLLIRTRKWYSKGRDLKLWKVTLREYDDSQYDLEKKKRKGEVVAVNLRITINQIVSVSRGGKLWPMGQIWPPTYFLWIKFYGNMWSKVKWSCSVMSDSLQPHGL